MKIDFTTIDREFDEFVGSDQWGNAKWFYKPFKVKSFLHSSIEKAVKEAVEKMIGERKSVEELKEKMGSAYNDLSVQVAYKEGYNQHIKDMDFF